jgi:sterol desaturase/sphingolipid hydroxylase (fatty acid hydroxylase superfamily)
LNNAGIAMTENLKELLPLRLSLPAVLLVAFWTWETWRPFFAWKSGRLRHAVHNIALALINTAVLALVFGTATVLVADWTTSRQLGLLNSLSLGEPVKFILALLLLDAWMYVWHRANHTIPLLWRFHRMHHSDHRMDVTTATRFHLGEHFGGNVLRLGLIPALGVSIWPIVFYELLLVANTQFHHANISIGRFDRWLRLVIVTPDMHKVHHSRWRPETDSNYSTVLSIWDRLARSFRMRPDPKTLEFGLDDFDDAQWQTLWGMLKTPLAPNPSPPGDPEVANEADREFEQISA